MSDALPQSSRLDLPLPLLPQTALESSVLASTILESLADAVVVYDAAGRLVESNPAAVTLFGLARPGRREALAIPIAEREAGAAFFTLEGQPLPREDWPAVRVLRGETFTGADTLDLVVHTANGQARILNISGAPLLDAHRQVTGAVCVCRDMTERTRLERELAQRAAELETIFTTQVEGVVFIDTTGRIVRMNEAQRQLLAARGIDPTTAHIATWAQQVPPRDAAGQPFPVKQLPYYRALRGETVTGEQAVEVRQRALDGRDIVLRISGAPVRDGAGGRILGAVLTTYDVTEQRRLEQQRLEMMRVVAHDLTNPVAAVRLYFQAQQRRLRQGQPPFQPDDALLGEMDYALERMERLLDDLRVATRVELGLLALQRTRQDVAALCRAEAAAQQAVTGRVVAVETPRGPVWAEVDRERLGQVIANLLSNALKYSPADQPVGVTVRVQGALGALGALGAQGGTELAGTALRAGTAGVPGDGDGVPGVVPEPESGSEPESGPGVPGVVEVAVRDGGPGIALEEQGRLFEQFHRVAGIRAQSGASGLGLGLYISKAIVTQHGGTIGVESAPGAGSTFWFRLPLAPT